MCTCLSVTQAVKHSVSQDDGAGGQAAEEMEVNQERESRATDWEREEGGKARFTSPAPCSMWSGAYSLGQEERKESCPF